LSVPTSLNLIRFNPLSGTSLMIFELLVFALIDTYFGGNCRYEDRGSRLHQHRNADVRC
jgi:flagellar motor switch protein FliM